MRLLVVGGAGYIGSVVASQLLASGHEVIVADNLSTGHESAIPEGATFEEVDLLDGERLRGVVTPDLDGVLHFAAASLVGESVANPAKYFRINVGGTANLLEAMHVVSVRRLVFSSTAATYGEPQRVPIVETDLARPTNPYGASKLAVDQLISFEAEARGLAAVSLRYFNVAGASGRQGERHDPETHLIPLVLQVAAGARESIAVYGTDYPTPDGTAIRDYIHVEDLAVAHLLALDAAGGAGHQIYNLGNGEGFSVRQVIDAARRVTGRDIAAIEAPRRQGDPVALVASSERIRGELGWAPRKPTLEEMIGDAWAFEQTYRTVLS